MAMGWSVNGEPLSGATDHKGRPYDNTAWVDSGLRTSLQWVRVDLSNDG